MPNATFTPDDDEFAGLTRRAVRSLPDAPAAWQRKAIGLWPAQGLQGALTAALRHVAAVLSFDSWAATPALAMRSGASGARQMVFEAPVGSVELRIAPQGAAWTLSGQWLGPDDTGSIELLADPDTGAPALASALDDLGGFRLDGVGRGQYRLTLAVGADLIELPALEVGEPPR